MINICPVFLPPRGKSIPVSLVYSQFQSVRFGGLPHVVWMQAAWPMGTAFLYLQPVFCLKTTVLTKFKTASPLDPSGLGVPAPASSRSTTIPCCSLFPYPQLLQVPASMLISAPMPPMGP